MQERGIAVYEAAGGVQEVQPAALILGDGQTVPFDECLWTTQVWPALSRLLHRCLSCWCLPMQIWGLPPPWGVHLCNMYCCCSHPLLQASAASWLAETGLPVDKDGFLLVNDCLQSDGGPPNVFAAGDVASNSRNPQPKAGVFAVRAVSG